VVENPLGISLPEPVATVREPTARRAADRQVASHPAGVRLVAADRHAREGKRF
jgi:hypothetical protein